jgi:hypothetical protein
MYMHCIARQSHATKDILIKQVLSQGVIHLPDTMNCGGKLISEQHNISSITGNITA